MLRMRRIPRLAPQAYRIDPRLVDGPAWLNERDSQFVIHATMPEGAARAQVPEMMKALEERFHLVVAKNAPKLKPAREMDRSECPEWTESIPTDGKKNFMCRTPEADGGFPGTVLMTNSYFGPTRNTGRRTENGVETRWEYFRITMPLLAEALESLNGKSVDDAGGRGGAGVGSDGDRG